MHGQKTKIT